MCARLSLQRVQALSEISTVEQDTNSLIKLKKVVGANRVYFLLFLPVGLTVHLVAADP